MGKANGKKEKKTNRETVEAGRRKLGSFMTRLGISLPL